MTKREYRAPQLIEYGEVHEVTLGASGPFADAVIQTGGILADPNNPNCINNVGSGYCYHT